MGVQTISVVLLLAFAVRGSIELQCSCRNLHGWRGSNGDPGNVSPSISAAAGAGGAGGPHDYRLVYQGPHGAHLHQGMSGFPTYFATGGTYGGSNLGDEYFSYGNSAPGSSETSAGGGFHAGRNSGHGCSRCVGASVHPSETAGGGAYGGGIHWGHVSPAYRSASVGSTTAGGTYGLPFAEYLIPVCGSATGASFAAVGDGFHRGQRSGRGYSGYGGVGPVISIASPSGIPIGVDGSNWSHGFDSTSLAYKRSQAGANYGEPRRGYSHPFYRRNPTAYSIQYTRDSNVPSESVSPAARNEPKVEPVKEKDFEEKSAQ